jgi:hypothetical protein
MEEELLRHISSFAKMSEPDRMVFIAKVHHAIWHDEATYQRIKNMINYAEKNLPSAEYFQPTEL